MNKKTDAILLIGPTGSGKTPLGAYIEKRGIFNRPCSHFDFGEHLRRCATQPLPSANLSNSDYATIKSILTKGALLDDSNFHIAEKLLQAHITMHALQPETMIILNGLPRHTGQADALRPIIHIARVIHLQCTPETVFQRITKNSGGDRTNRTDDTPAEIKDKLNTYHSRTRPLLDYYTRANVPIHTINISATTTPEQITATINARPVSSPDYQNWCSNE